MFGRLTFDLHLYVRVSIFYVIVILDAQVGNW